MSACSSTVGSSLRSRKHSSVRNSPTPSTGALGRRAGRDSPSATLASSLTGGRRRSRPGPVHDARRRAARRPRRPARVGLVLVRVELDRAGRAVDEQRGAGRRSSMRAGGADHARDAELAGDDRGVAGRAAALGDQRERRASGRGRRCPPARGPRRPGRDGSVGSGTPGSGSPTRWATIAALDVAQVGDPLGHQAAHPGEDRRRTARRRPARRRAGRSPALRFLRTAPRSPLSRARPALAVSTSAAAPDACRPCGEAVGDRAGRVVVRRQGGVCVGKPPSPKRAIASGETSPRTRRTGPKATPGTTGVPLRTVVRGVREVTMVTS